MSAKLPSLAEVIWYFMTHPLDFIVFAITFPIVVSIVIYIFIRAFEESMESLFEFV